MNTKVPAPETSTQAINSRELSPAQLRLCVSGTVFCSGITPCTGCLGMIRDEVLSKAMNAAGTSPSQQGAFLHVFMGACVNGNDFCTGINPCEPCLIKIKNELLPTAIAAMALSRRDQAMTLMQVFLDTWREMLIRYVTERSQVPQAFQQAPLEGEFAPPQAAQSAETYEIDNPNGILNLAAPQGQENNQAHGGQALNGSNGHKPKPQNVVRRPSKKQVQSALPAEKKEK